MKVDACDAACSIDHRISGSPRPIVEFLYICIIEARSGCAWKRKSLADDIRCSVKAARGYRSCQVPNAPVRLGDGRCARARGATGRIDRSRGRVAGKDRSPAPRGASRAERASERRRPRRDRARCRETDIRAHGVRRKESMRMPRLRCAGARRGLVRQRVAVEHDDLFEMGRDGFRRRETSHPRADNDGLLQNRIWHA